MIQPMSEDVLVRIQEAKDLVIDGVVVPGRFSTPPPPVVIAVGAKVSEPKVGESIIPPARYTGRRIRIRGALYQFMKASEVLAVVR